MASSPSTYADSKAPREDGQILIWPEPARLLADAQENQRDLAGATQTVQNVPLFQVRRRMRQWLVGDAHSQVLFGDGHQTELHHAGVWAKRVSESFDDASMPAGLELLVVAASAAPPEGR